MGTKRQSQIFLSEVVLDEHPRLTLSELCQARGLNAETVIEMVNEGVLEVRGSSPSEWMFTSDSLCRINAVLRLQQDLGINLAGAALALELLDELRKLRTRLKTLAHNFPDW